MGSAQRSSRHRPQESSCGVERVEDRLPLNVVPVAGVSAIRRHLGRKWVRQGRPSGAADDRIGIQDAPPSIPLASASGHVLVLRAPGVERARAYPTSRPRRCPLAAGHPHERFADRLRPDGRARQRDRPDRARSALPPRSHSPCTRSRRKGLRALDLKGSRERLGASWDRIRR